MLPKSINVMGIEYAVHEVPVIDKTEPLKGRIDYLTSEIFIDESMNEDMKKQVLFHEVLHAILDAIGQYDICENETAVQSLATALYCTLKEWDKEQ